MDRSRTRQLIAVATTSVIVMAGVVSAPLASAATTPTTVADSIARIRASVGMTSALNGRGVDVAVIDTGVVPLPMFNSRLSYGPDLSNDAGDVNRRNLDAFGHGTNVAGIIAGVAPESRIVSVKVGDANGTTSVAQLVSGIDWIAANAQSGGRNIRVLNVSFGLIPGPEGLVVAAALRRAWAKGIVVVASAGNDSFAGLTAPANDPQFIAIGAADISTVPPTVASFSATAGMSFRNVDVLAPGVSIVGPRVPGSYLDQQFPNARVGLDGFRGSGTSQAAAATSGIAASLLALRPWLTPNQLKSMIRRYATRLLAASLAAQGCGVVAAGTTAAATESNSAIADWENAVASFQTPLLNFVQLQAPLSGSSWNGIAWSGNRWSGNRWSGNRWSGTAWE